MPHYDCIVLGTGAVGSAALWHLARRGVKALGIDRFTPGHDRGSSHGTTRMIRQAYFEHPDYVPLVRRAFEQWAELESSAGKRLYRETGLLEIGPRDGEVVPGVLASAEKHRLPVESLSSDELRRRYPMFHVREDFVGVFEHRAGYLLVEECIVAMTQQALLQGAALHVGETIVEWHGEGGGVVVRTDRETYHAGALVLALGAWSPTSLASLGLSLVVRRKPQYWYATADARLRVESGFPAWLFELPQGIFYGFPQLDPRGMKIAEHTGGSLVDDPLAVDRQLDRLDQQRVEQFLAEQMPGMTRDCTHHSVCLYTLSPDQHFYVDRHPARERVAFAAGLSGHGFKFAPVLGEALVDLALEGQTPLPVQFLSRRREGK